jgi:protein-S-isoprenylcysteine O-methyltransferase Ste14
MQLTALELRIPPLLLVLFAALGMHGADRYLPGLNFVFPEQKWVAGLLGAVGVGIVVAGVVAFRRARTTVDPLHPERAALLVTGGVYRMTRNPMYLGMLLALGGTAVYIGNWGALALLPCFVAVIARLQIVPEERWMQERFGDDFQAYRRRVRRWL